MSERPAPAWPRVVAQQVFVPFPEFRGDYEVTPVREGCEHIGLCDADFHCPAQPVLLNP